MPPFTWQGSGLSSAGGMATQARPTIGEWPSQSQGQASGLLGPCCSHWEGEGAVQVLGSGTRQSQPEPRCELDGSGFGGACIPLHLLSQILVYPQLSHHPVPPSTCCLPVAFWMVRAPAM